MLNQSEVKRLFNYNEKTGYLTRRTVEGGNIIGSVAGTLGPDGYVRIGIKQRTYLVHKIIWLWKEGYFPEYEIDHRNRIRNDNSWDNLRHISISCNRHNKDNPINNTSGIKGVSWVKASKKWMAGIMCNKIMYDLGRSEDIVEAVAHRLAGEECLNIGDCNNMTPARRFINRHMDANQT